MIQQLEKLFDQINKKNGVIFDKEGTLNIITSLIGTNMRLDQYDSVADAAKLLNTLQYLRCHDKVNTRGDSVSAFWNMLLQLQDRIAVENIIKWIETYNEIFEQSIGTFRYPESLKKSDISCFITRCHENHSIDQEQEQLFSRLQKFHDHLDFLNVDVNVHDFDDCNVDLYLKVYDRHFNPNGDGVLWKKLVNGNMSRVFSYKAYTGEQYKTINQFYRGQGKVEDMTPFDVLNALLFTSSYMFPATLSTDLVVYRYDSIKICPEEFKCKGYYSTALLFDSCKHFALVNESNVNNKIKNRLMKITIPAGTKFLPTFAVVSKETEITLLPGTRLKLTTLDKEKSGDGKVQIRFCEYTITETPPEMTRDLKRRLFKVAMTYDVEGGEQLLEDVRGFFREHSQ